MKSLGLKKILSDSVTVTEHSGSGVVLRASTSGGGLHPHPLPHHPPQPSQQGVPVQVVRPQQSVVMTTTAAEAAAVAAATAAAASSPEVTITTVPAPPSTSVQQQQDYGRRKSKRHQVIDRPV